MKIRPIEILRAIWGAGLLVSPRAVLERVHGVRVDRKAIVIARILGARHMVQASLSGLDPSPEILAGGVWVDSVHSMTAIGLAVVDRSRARAGVTDALIAALWAVFGWHDLRTGTVPPQSHDRGRDQLARKVFGALPGAGPLMARARTARDR
jgi:hypothetical protein